MFRKYSVLLLILFIVGLYLIQNKAIMPFVEKVVESDAFMEDSEGEDEQLGNIRNDRTDLAFAHCKEAFNEKYASVEKAELSPNQYQAWALASRSYLVRSPVRVPEAEGAGTVEKAFACKIQLTGTDPADPASWTVSGIDFAE